MRLQIMQPLLPSPVPNERLRSPVPVSFAPILRVGLGRVGLGGRWYPTLSPFLLQKALDAGWDDLHVIKSILRRSYRGTLSFCRFFGFDPMTMGLNVARAPLFVRQLIEYQ